MASSSLVSDASVLARWFLRDEGLLAEADALLDEWVGRRVVLLAPAHLPFELTHSILRAERRGRLTRVAAQQAVAEIAHLQERLVFLATTGVAAGGADLAAAYGVNFYDACYLHVARRLGTDLLTADEAFYRGIGTQPDVIWFGDYSTSA